MTNLGASGPVGTHFGDTDGQSVGNDITRGFPTILACDHPTQVMATEDGNLAKEVSNFSGTHQVRC